MRFGIRSSFGNDPIQVEQTLTHISKIVDFKSVFLRNTIERGSYFTESVLDFKFGWFDVLTLMP